MKLSYGITLVMSILAIIEFVVGIGLANGAPQEASASAIALSMALIPYVFARCIEKLPIHKNYLARLSVRSKSKIAIRPA